MKISTKGRYALRIMVDLAINGNGQFISLKNISIKHASKSKMRITGMAHNRKNDIKRLNSLGRSCR